MEKIGLFDIIDKFNSAASGKNDFSATKARQQNDNKPAENGFALKDPDDFAPPQYMMNAKMLAFMKRHDELVAAVPPRAPQKRGRKKKSELPAQPPKAEE